MSTNFEHAEDIAETGYLSLKALKNPFAEIFKESTDRLLAIARGEIKPAVKKILLRNGRLKRQKASPKPAA